MPRIQLLDSWRGYPNYRLIWTANFFANSAQWLQLLTVGWLVQHLAGDSGASPLLVVTVGGLNTLPGLIVGPWGGVLGDRIDRRKLVMAIQALMAALALAFAFFVLSGGAQVWHAYAYVFISGMCISVTQPMGMALIANTVPREYLSNAFAANVLTITGTRFIGPFVGGLLIANLGFFWNFTIESLLYAGMVIALLPMKTPYYQPRRAEEQGSVMRDLVDGVRYVWSGNRAIFLLIALGMIPNVVLQPLMFMLPVFTEQVLGAGADVGGYLLAVNGGGGLVAATLMASLGFIFMRGPITLTAAIASSVLAIAFAQARWLPVAFVIIAMFAFSQSWFRTTSGALIQTLVPDSLRSRVTSFQSYGRGFVVPASLAVGWLTGLTSVPFAVTAMGLVSLAGALAFLAMARSLRRLA